jgi:hypothetical protein
MPSSFHIINGINNGSELTSEQEALNFAEKSIKVFQHPFKSIEDIEKNGKEALELLNQRHVFLVVSIRIYRLAQPDNSVCSIPCFSSFTRSQTDPSKDKFSVLSIDTVIQWYEEKIQVGNLPAIL